ncbi:hypothetical protein ACFPRL_30735 [Pseudoclavibacter helvolus]
MFVAVLGLLPIRAPESFKVIAAHGVQVTGPPGNRLQACPEHPMTWTSRSS